MQHGYFWVTIIRMTNRTPAKKTRGRPPIDPGNETQKVAIRLTLAQKEKLDKLGGSPWVRQKIDRAKLPTPKE